MGREVKKLLLTSIAALFLATGAAHATADGCAVVLRTPDGFLNVRAAPKMGSRILKRLKPGEIIGTDNVSEGWERTYVSRKKNGLPLWGWVYSRFIVDVDCESLDNKLEGMGPQ
jgi:hypothetical protein